MKVKFKSVIIDNEKELVDYIEGTSRISEKHAEETTSLEEVKTRLLEAVTNLRYFIDHGAQIDCMKGWDKVHVFTYKSHYNSQLSVFYRGTMK